MIGLRLLCVLAAIGLAGCASEGGVTGTGVSSISGNVVQVTQTSVAALALPFPIRVTVEELPSATAVTDADGAFTLRGAFSGTLTLQFANAADGTAIGPLSLEVPAGSSTVLENIEIRTMAPLPERVRPRAVRQLDVFGRADLIECAADGSGTLLVSDDGRPPRQYLAMLTADTVILDRDGAPLTCAELHAAGRPQVRVEGLLRLADQTIVATQVMVAQRRPARPDGDAPRAEGFRGVVSALFCSRDVIEVTQTEGPDSVRRLVHLGEDSELHCTDVPCRCADVMVGDDIAVRGRITPGLPGLVEATVVTVDSPAARFEAPPSVAYS
ncbi:MAG: hypothetical protein ABI629_14335 [bacterium]